MCTWLEFYSEKTHTKTVWEVIILFTKLTNINNRLRFEDGTTRTDTHTLNKYEVKKW